MINALIKLLLFQAAGEFLAGLFALSVPGPLLGMLLLFLFLLARGAEDEGLSRLSAHALPHLNLLFIPASVGIIVHFQRVLNEWLPILVSLVLSTSAAILVTALVIKGMQREA